MFNRTRKKAFSASELVNKGLVNVLATAKVNIVFMNDDKSLKWKAV